MHVNRKLSLGLLFFFVSMSSCVKTEGFECETNDECGELAQCEPSGFCSFADAACDTGFRFGEESGDGAGQCTLSGKDVFDDGQGVVGDEKPVEDSEPFSLSNVRLTNWHKRLTTVTLDNRAIPYVFNTDTGTLGLENSSENLFEEETSFSIESQFNGPNVGVLLMGNLDVKDGVVLKIEGSNSGILVASNAMDISGEIMADAGSGRPDKAGPGGYSGGQSLACDGGGPGGGRSGGSPDFGAGGGGHVAHGGQGGDWGGDPFSPGGLGGETHGNANLIPLIGGSGGGCGGGNVDVARGGGGGGALQLSAGISISVRTTGALSANGGGGEGGSTDNAGAGGGAGGALLLESRTVLIEGHVTANGGGGGAGANGQTKGADGQHGRRDSTRAFGGVGNGQGSSGGNGGAGTTASGSDGIDTAGLVDTDDNAGAGGGSAGRVRIRGRIIDVLEPVSPSAGYHQTRDI